MAGRTTGRVLLPALGMSASAGAGPAGAAIPDALFNALGLPQTATPKQLSDALVAR